MMSLGNWEDKSCNETEPEELPAVYVEVFLRTDGKTHDSIRISHAFLCIYRVFLSYRKKTFFIFR